MRTYDEKTTVVEISELRNKEKVEKLLQAAKMHKVILERRHKGLGVALVNLRRLEEMQKTLDMLEDFALGYIAQEREESVKASDYIDINEW